MHFNSLQAMKIFVKEYLDPKEKLRILEVGSYCDSKPERDRMFRRYFRDKPNWKFIGMDLMPGPNVDVVSKHKYRYPFKDNSFDVVISGNTLEHVEDTHQWIRELARISNNLVCVIVPSVRPEHKYPIDCWRVYPDGMKFLLEKVAGLRILKCKLVGDDKDDTVGVGEKHVTRTRLVVEKHLKRLLKHEESVHHIDGKSDDLKNLYLFSLRSDHTHYHAKLKRKQIELISQSNLI